MQKLIQYWPFRMLFLLRKVFLTRATRRYYSQYGEDITYDRMISMKRKGFFVDVGCHHPTKYSNTYKLYRHGWRGVNVDLDPLKIAAFNLRRPGDHNVACAIAEEAGELTAYSQGIYTVTETVDPEAAAKMRSQGLELTEFKVKCGPLTAILDDSPYRDRRIDILSVDVEGAEMAVFRTLDFDRYQPKLIVAESHERNLAGLMKDEVFEFLVAKGYELFNWTGPSLLFVHQRPGD